MQELDKRKRVIQEGKDSGIKILIETGTAHGAMVEACIPHFNMIHSIELSFPFYIECVKRFGKNTNVVLWHGDSAQILPSILESGRIVPNEPCIYWLDAHCSGGDTAGDPNNSPLEAEIAAILQYRTSGIILIDDQHLTPPELAMYQDIYPGFEYTEPITRIDISRIPR